MRTATIHHIKTEAQFFEAALNGTKTFEVRKNDRTPGFAIGQFLVMAELEDNTCRTTGRTHTVKITYVLIGIEPSTIPSK